MNWTGKPVLVTGAGGFIGSHLTERLVTAGAQVRAFVHYNALGMAGWLEHSPLRAQMEVFAGDVCDPDSVSRAVAGRAIVFHLGALIAIPYSYHAPNSYVRVNIEGTLNVLQAARAANIERLVHTSTSEVYGTARYAPIDEAHPLQAQSPYAASKIGADKLVEAFHLSFGVPAVTVRPFNTFGPRQSARAVIPTIITQCLADAPVRLGNLHPTRDLNYVSNTVDGFIAAAEAPDALGRTVNLGSGQEISVGALAELIARLMGQPLRLEQSAERARPAGSEVERLIADSQLALKILNWHPRISLPEGLQLTIDWLRQHREQYHAHSYIL